MQRVEHGKRIIILTTHQTTTQMKKINEKSATAFKERVALTGKALYEETSSFSFSPQRKPRKPLPTFQRKGRAEQMANGKFTFMPEKSHASESTTILKTRHGRLSKTKDGRYLASLSTPINSGEDFKGILSTEVLEMINCLNNSPLTPEGGTL